ncbi:MAG: proteinral secretion pathway protein D [Methylococcaceae bacterium NSP1-2]|nr:type II secretion system secretin GspD [Methylococcaceae bacterium]OYV18465.1 MAG: proteinral secretion pathway protein D [Methylococcaceae bacterium NSP1-2]
MQIINKTITIACFALTTGLMLSACESSAPPKQTLKLPPTSTTETASSSKKTQAPTTVLSFSDVLPAKNQPTSIIKEPVDLNMTRTKSELYPATGDTVSSTTLSNKKHKSTAKGSYSLNFDDADLAEVAKTILSDSLGENYVLSPEVKGKVTLQTTQALTKDELLPTLEMVLRMNNAALVKDGNIYHIEPAANALYTSELSIGSNMAGYQTKVIPVRNVAAEEISKLLKPLVQEKTILQIDNDRNILVVSGTGDEVQRVQEMVGAFDTDVLKGRSFALFSLAHVEPETVIKELEAVFNDKSGDKDAGFFRFIPIERLNAILAITHQARYLNEIESWVLRLDKANTASGGSVNVYKVQHVDAVELADTLNEIFNNAAPKRNKAASVAPGQDMAEISSNTPATPVSASPQATGDMTVSDVGEVRIISDEPNNSLIIVATAQEYERILPIIKQLDVMPLQVLIDATIVEVDLKNDLKYGMQWSFDTGNFRNLLSNISSGDLKAIGPVTGYSLFYSGGTAKAVLNALAEKSAINVIASPSLMVLNNQEGFINVGDKVPVATSQSTNTNSVNTSSSGILNNNDNVSAIVSNNIQMLDTGITLKIKPRVNAGGLVLMKIEQEANQAVATTTSALNSPTIQQRKINSSIAVKNGETIVLGGLIREDTSDGLTGMPILSEIPYIGALFGTTTKNKNKTELVILITPRIVENEKNARDVTDEFKRKLTGIYPETPHY